MAPRFFASPYKNATGQIPKKDGWWSELPVSTAVNSDCASLIRTASDFWLAQGSSAGSLVCLPYDEPAKFGNKAPTLSVGSKAVTEFDVSPFDELVATAHDSGKIGVHALPSLDDFTDATSAVSASSSVSLSLSSTRAVDLLAFHPTTSSLLLAASQSIIALYDVSSRMPAISLSLPSPVWSAAWSYDGRLVSTTSKDGALRLFDPRAGTSAVGETVAHPGLKCSRHVALKGDQFFSTGFSKMRDREYSLWDARSLAKPIKSNRLDTGTGVLMPVVDHERNIVYIAGRGDMTLRWVEVGGPTTFTEGATQLPVTTAAIALAPPSTLNLMKAEINRVMVLTNEAVVPIPIEVPRRQLIDFHSDLFPPVPARVPAQGAHEWIEGADALCDLLPQDPSRAAAPVKRTAPVPNPLPVAASIKHPVATTPAPAPAPVPAPAVVPAEPKPEEPVAALEGLSLATPAAPPPIEESNAVTATAPAPTGVKANSFAPAALSFKSAPAATAPGAASPAPVPTPATIATSTPASPPAAAALTSASKIVTPAPAPAAQRAPAQASNPLPEHWSRNFLSGSSPLKPDYFGLNALSVTMSADVPLLKANARFAVFPLSGPGGKVAVHPLANKGRFEVNLPAFCAGATVSYFELDPFDEGRMFVAGDDGKIRLVRIPEAGLEEDTSEVEGTLEDPGMDKISELVHHPAAKDLLLSVSDDRGKATIRLWDLAKREVAKSVAMPANGVTSVAWSPDGSKLAVATKDKKLLVLDPRTDAAALSSAAHDSVRPTKVAWLSDSDLISTGFTRGALRQLNLYALAGQELKIVAQQTLDQVPAPLFPHVDLDSSVLFLYSRGDRSALAYEIQPGAQKPFTKLPSFEGSTFQSGFSFLPKTQNDIKRVELVRGLRLSPNTLEVVSWCVPRARGEFFQDDVFPPTRDTTSPRLSAVEWLGGKDGEVKWVNLKPEGMTPLSQAPVVAKRESTRDKISGEIKLTESQKQEQYMNRLFTKAKEEESDEEPDTKSHAPVQDDDDW